MRVLAHLATALCLAAAGWAGWLLWSASTAPPPPAVVVGPASGAAQRAVEPAPPRSAGRWPPLFGELQPPAPPVSASAPPEPQPPSPPLPPLESLGYRLNGVVRALDATWAIVGHPTGERLLRVGDTLEPGLTIVRIGDDGLWLSRDGGPPEPLAFPEGG